jgi:hypothetical protein
MINRIAHHLEPPEPGPSLSYYLVETRDTAIPVSRAEAQRIVLLLSQWRVPRWIVFVNLYGASERLRARLIERVFASTPHTRASRRAHQRALEEEQERDEWSRE